ncbi:MAG: InlB B-repeat-containing protein, partial [Alphaproteobacteria bacterium]|nr:InlB B-repeat-containing protein [Alphaproteobacteria bacterium]
MASLFLVFFTANAFAAGYSCPTYKMYTSCIENYFLADTDVSDIATSEVNACSACPGNSTNTVSTATSCTCKTGYSVGGATTTTGTACSANTYTVTYNSNKPSGASGTISGSTANSTHTYGTAKALTTNGYSLTGWTFAGWNTKADGTGTSYANGASVTNLTSTYNGTVTLYAKWTVNTLTINYNTSSATSGTPSVSQQTCSYDGACTAATQGTMVKTKMVFLGWTKTSGGTTVDYAADASIKNIISSGSITLYAVWKTPTCSATKGTATLKSVTNNTPVCTITCSTGYTQGGGTNATGTFEVNGSAGATSASGTCKAITFTVAYTKDPSSATGTVPSNQTCTYDGTCTAATNPFSHTGYMFNKWSCTASSGSCAASTYASGDSLKNATSVAGATITLKSTWDANTITLNWANGGHGTAPTSPASCKYDSTFTMPAAMTASGYTFNKWSVNGKTFNAGTTGVACTSANLGVSSGAVTITGTWTANNYSISLDNASATNNGTATIYTTYKTNVYLDDARSKAMTASANAITEPTRAYTVTYDGNGGSVSATSATATYTFNGYYNTSSNGTQYINSNGNITSDGLNAAKDVDDNTTTWYAQWTSKSVTLPTPTRTGYTFKGWAESSTATGGDTGSYTPTKNVTLYAIWSQNTYAVAYSCGDGAGTAPSSTTATYDNSFTPAANTCTRSGYNFAGWTVSGTSDTKTAGSAFTWTYTEGKTFTAKWTAEGEAEINYVTNGGTINGSYMAACNVETATFSLPTDVTKPGYTFNGWYTASTGGTKVTSVVKGTCTSALTYYAQWTACDSTTAGACNCTSSQYPDNGTCTNCSHSCASVTGYTLGTYNVCEAETDLWCYRNCTTTDIPNSTGVSGIVTKGGKILCAATTCADDFYISGSGCQSCPENATCGGEAEWSCDEGYKKTANGLGCEPNTYTVTLNANGGTGGTASVTATYNSLLQTATMPERDNYNFLGYYDTDATTGGNQYY